MFTDSLWIPENTPPQINGEVSANLQKQIHEYGAIEIANAAVDQLNSDQQRIGSYIEELGFYLNSTINNVWPAWALRLGAALAYLGYDYSKQSTIVDETFDLSRDLAELQGIPDAYATSMYSDQALQALIDTAFEDDRLQAKDGQGLLQLSIIGAGCLRFYMQEAILAA